MAQFADPNIDTYAQKLIMASGSATEPAICFANDLTKGIYFDPATGMINTVGFAGGGSGATAALDNLAAVAINASLLPDVANTIDLGSAALPWRTGYFDTGVRSDNLYAGASFDANTRIQNNGDLNFIVSSKQQLQLDGLDINCIVRALGLNNTGSASDASINLSTDAGTVARISCDNGAAVYFGENTANNFVVSYNSNLSSPVITAATAGVAIKGTTTNDNATAGFVGEEVESIISTYTNFNANGTIGDMTSITLTAGDWDVTIDSMWFRNGATFTSTNFGLGLSSTSGNSFTGLVTGDNIFYFEETIPVTFVAFPHHIAIKRVSIGSTTTYYAKSYLDTYTAGNPQFKCRLSARRVR